MPVCSGFLQNFCEWNARVVTRRPKLILAIISLLSSSCLAISLLLHPLPSFSDPHLGFETRGTEISKRLISFENLLDSELRQSPPLPSVSYSPGIQAPLKWGKLKVVKKKKKVKKKYSSLQFCLNPDHGHSQVVMSGYDLWTLESVRAMCRLEAELVAPTEFSRFCERRGPRSTSCCSPWSLPNYIAYIHNKTSCLDLTEEDIINTKRLIEECRQYYFLDERSYPVYSPKETVVNCKRKQAIFNITYYLLDSEYVMNFGKLENVLLILPLAQSSAVLPYFKSIPFNSLRLSNVSVTAYNFGVKDALFNEMLLKDSWLLLVGAGLVTMCYYFYTDSFLFTLATLVALLFSLSFAYFLYIFVFRLSFFPFINLLSSVVVIGVGGDASLILFKVWWRLAPSYFDNGVNSEEIQLKRAGQDRSSVELFKSVYRSSLEPLMLTSFTTATAFFASYISSITSIACFGLFSGIVTLSNLVVTWWWIPSWLVILGKRKDSKQAAKQIGKLVLLPRKLWLTIFPSLTFLAGMVILYHGGLPVEEKSSFQLMLSSHPIEKFYSVYSQKFWMYKVQSNLEKVALRWVWGVVPEDSGDPNDPDTRGSVRLDPTFNLSHPDAQLFLYNFCRNIRREEWYEGRSWLSVVGASCFPESFARWMNRRCVADSDSPCCGRPAVPPYPPHVYNQCAVKLAQSIMYPHAHPIAGPYFSPSDPEQLVRALVIQFESNQTYTTSYVDMDQFYHKLEGWTKEQMSSAPSSVSNGWFLSDLHLYDVQSSLRYDTGMSFVIAVSLVLLLLTISTRDLYLALAAVLTVSGSTLTVAAILLLLDWHLDVLESTTASLAVGLAVDFTIHYALHYKKSKKGSYETLDEIGGPTLVCMITSCLAGLVMIPSQVLPYRRVAVFLLVLMPVSWIYSTLWFMSLLPTKSSRGVS